MKAAITITALKAAVLPPGSIEISMGIKLSVWMAVIAQVSKSKTIPRAKSERKRKQ